MAKGKNEMSNNSVSTTSDENTQETLDLLFAKDQQTYDEFLSGFLYLTKAQLEEHDVTGSLNTSDVTGGKTNCETDLQQEILGPGDYCSSQKDRPKLSKLQLDNFVDDESSVSDDDRVDYCPSICEERTRIQESHSKSISCSTPGVGTFGTNPDDSPTNKIVTLPGEIEIYDSTKVKVNLRSLNICTELSESSECASENSSNSVYQEVQESCEVVHFQMDDKFDYDNVQLQPKFQFPIG